MAILALEKDLFFAVKIRDTLRHHNHEVTIVRTLPAFEEALTHVRRDAPTTGNCQYCHKGS